MAGAERTAARASKRRDPWRACPPSAGSTPGRFSSDEVFQWIVADADHEITSGSRELFFSALAGGFAITITFLLYASRSATSRRMAPEAAAEL